MIDRIRELMDYKGLTSSQFADTVEVPRAVISHILSGRNNPSLEVVTKIVSAFPDININWVLLGEGEMLTKLVSKIEPKQTPGKVEASAPTQVEEETVSVKQTEKVQNNEKPQTDKDKPAKQEKEIEQIVIFYTDKSFIAYKP
jgi:transcriptional regulator with XRE-family HTH domain